MNLLEQLSAVLGGFEANARDLAVSAEHAEQAVSAAVEAFRQAHATAARQLESSLTDILRSHAAKARTLQEAAASGAPPMPVATFPQPIDTTALGVVLGAAAEEETSPAKEPAQ